MRLTDTRVKLAYTWGLATELFSIYIRPLQVYWTDLLVRQTKSVVVTRKYQPLVGVMSLSMPLGSPRCLALGRGDLRFRTSFFLEYCRLNFAAPQPTKCSRTWIPISYSRSLGN